MLGPYLLQFGSYGVMKTFFQRRIFRTAHATHGLLVCVTGHVLSTWSEYIKTTVHRDEICPRTLILASSQSSLLEYLRVILKV